MQIKLIKKEETAETTYTALTISVKINSEDHILKTILTKENTTNSEQYLSDVGEFKWLSPEPEDNNKRLEIEESAKEFFNQIIRDADYNICIKKKICPICNEECLYDFDYESLKQIRLTACRCSEYAQNAKEFLKQKKMLEEFERFYAEKNAKEDI